MALNPGHIWITRTQISIHNLCIPSTEHCQLTPKLLVQWHISVTPVLGRLRQEGQCRFKASLGNTVRRKRERWGEGGEGGARGRESLEGVEGKKRERRGVEREERGEAGRKRFKWRTPEKPGSFLSSVLASINPFLLTSSCLPVFW